MIRVKAKIKLYTEGRFTPFKSGYRPLFNFYGTVKTSGQITILEGNDFKLGEEKNVEIAFVNEVFLGEGFGIGSEFTFSEGATPFGEGVVLQIL